jgi:NAD(P)H-nitrite reductase large subunit
LGGKNKDENKNLETQSQDSGNRDCPYPRDHMDVSDDRILACRCMEISENSIREAIRQGANTVDAVKRATMAGMGLCQSKICFNIIAGLISEETKIPLSQIRPMKIRIPVRPVKINSLDTRIQ